MQLGYFGLNSGYKTPFKNPTTHKYCDGVVFEEIISLYKYDESLRELFLKYILKIERHIRSLVSNYFSEKYGEAQSCYLNPANFSSEPCNRSNVSRLIRCLNDLVNVSTDYPYINHQRNTYGNVPLWVAINGLTFGSLSKFYMLLTPDLRVKTAKNFDNVTDEQLKQFLTVITKFRNVCAHGERLYSYKTNEAIPDTNLHIKLKISKKGTQYIMGKQDLFSIVIAFKYLLSDNDFFEFKRHLVKLIKTYTNASVFITENKINELMGFPPKWKSISRCKR